MLPIGMVIDINVLKAANVVKTDRVIPVMSRDVLSVIANVDFGVLSSHDQLPVMELAYGDSQNRYSWIHYTVGRQRLTHFVCAHNFRNVSIFGVSIFGMPIFDRIFSKFFGPKNEILKIRASK